MDKVTLEVLDKMDSEHDKLVCPREFDKDMRRLARIGLLAELQESKPFQESPDEKQRINANFWDENLDEVIATIKEFSCEKATWSWIKNMDCKYVKLTFDMRDGAFVIINKNGERISLAGLKYQYKSGE